MISQYNLPRDQMYGVKNLVEIVSRRLLMRGFIVGDPDMGPRHSAGLAKDVGAWIADGSFKPLEHVVPGIDQGPAAFVGMLNGENVGKTILKVADP
jgi:NADPH-dependent curcumin reductase CurA